MDARNSRLEEFLIAAAVIAGLVPFAVMTVSSLALRSRFFGGLALVDLIPFAALWLARRKRV